MVGAQSKASSQFKSYDKRDDTDSVDYKYHAKNDFIDLKKNFK